MIIAIKNKITKPFSQLAWDLLGENKNGWVEQSAQTAENKAIKTPETGQKEKPTVQVVENLANKEAEQSAQTAENANEINLFNELAKEHLTKGNIKDYFDSNEISYKATDSLGDLISLLNEKLAGDVELLKSQFSI